MSECRDYLMRMVVASARRPALAKTAAGALLDAYRSEVRAEVLREAATEALAFADETENASTWESVGKWLNHKAEGN